VGVYVQNGGSNTIGGTAIADRNVISGNTVDGIQLDASSNNRVEGNYIGTDVTGMLDRGNTNQGIALFNASANNTIGGTAAGAGNVISGNNGFGIALSSAGSTGNLIQGNTIGLAQDGTTLLGNSSSGIEIAAGANGTTVGGAVAGARNVISGNANGVRIIGATGVVVAGNYIGLDAGGTLDRGNVNDGVTSR
jgi:titin